MEQEFFTWTGWDQQDTSCLAFYNCTLIKDIGTHKVGEHFKVIDVDYEKGKLTLVDQSGETIDEYDIGLVIK
jgi:hypothetical protein